MSSGSSSGSEDEGPEPGLAAERVPRSTAGNKMAKLLNAEEEDDFYKTTYGGFNVRHRPALQIWNSRTPNSIHPP